MNWASWSDFVAMGGYGIYVWGSFGACTIAMVLELALVRRRGKMIRMEMLGGTEPPHRETMP
jgi:heme exporter protein D